ncbi:MAG: DNA-3-methyladenine glycosylase I [Actinomycetota bacterium]|nr:DNA-3-methyladenine glycosylase I [Actinomycetota bacterium]
MGPDGLARCWWCAGDPLYESYHDTEWGRPVDQDARLFEKLSLEGFQSGLSWLTILRKRENFRRAFRSFEPESVARFNARSVQRLLQDSGIVRNRAKIEATINNARRCIELTQEFGSLAAYVWSFEPDPTTRPQKLDWQTLVKMPPSKEAVALSKDLRRRGWRFVGPTTAYSFMEGVGLVNDHLTRCDFREEVESQRARFQRPGYESTQRSSAARSTS